VLLTIFIFTPRTNNSNPSGTTTTPSFFQSLRLEYTRKFKHSLLMCCCLTENTYVIGLIGLPCSFPSASDATFTPTSSRHPQGIRAHARPRSLDPDATNISPRCNKFRVPVHPCIPDDARRGDLQRSYCIPVSLSTHCRSESNLRIGTGTGQ
jgi:hypothetical protein